MTFSWLNYKRFHQMISLSKLEAQNHESFLKIGTHLSSMRENLAMQIKLAI
jgi:hypothetical protein